MRRRRSSSRAWGDDPAMSEEDLERYRNAVRRGHRALARDEPEAALAAYREAASLAPDRPLPLAGIRQVHLQQAGPTGPLAPSDTALARSPRDETAPRGRGESLARLGRRNEAADALDILADVEETAGRLDDAWETTRR